MSQVDPTKPLGHNNLDPIALRRTEIAGGLAEASAKWLGSDEAKFIYLRDVGM